MESRACRSDAERGERARSAVRRGLVRCFPLHALGIVALWLALVPVAAHADESQAALAWAEPASRPSAVERDRHWFRQPDFTASLDHPRTVSARQSDMDENEFVLGFRVGSEARAYPMRMLAYHQVVNDRLGGRPVLATYCPHSGVTACFDTRPPAPAEFRVGGLYGGTLVVEDTETGSAWSPVTGRCVEGWRAGDELVYLGPGELETLGAWTEREPASSLVLPAPDKADLYFQPPGGWRGGVKVPPRIAKTLPEPDERLPASTVVIGFVAAGVPVAVARRSLAEDRVQVVPHAGGSLILTLRRDRPEVWTSALPPERLGPVQVERSGDPRGDPAQPSLVPIQVREMRWSAWHLHHPKTGLLVPERAP